MKSKIAIKTRKVFNDWLDIGNLFAKSLCDREEILRQFNALSETDRIKIKKRLDDCDIIRRTKITNTEIEDWTIGIMVDAHIIATEYEIDPLTVILCTKPICKNNEKIILRG